MDETLIEIIKGMLAPGIMISACGLLLLGMGNKYALVVNRIRTLNTEFRQLKEDNIIRRESILTQLPLLIRRMKIVQNAVFLYTISIALFIFSIFIIGIFFLFGKTSFLSSFAFILFIAALLSLLIGVIYAAREVRLGYEILNIETKNII
jgi:hypothetical protein